MTNFLPGQGDPNFNWGGGLASTSVIDDALQQSQDDETESQHTAALGFFSQQFNPYLNQHYPQMATASGEGNMPATPQPTIEPAGYRTGTAQAAAYGGTNNPAAGFTQFNAPIGYQDQRLSPASPEPVDPRVLNEMLARNGQHKESDQSRIDPYANAKAMQSGDIAANQRVAEGQAHPENELGGIPLAFAALDPAGFALQQAGQKGGENLGLPNIPGFGNVGSLILPATSFGGLTHVGPGLNDIIRGRGEPPVARMAPDYDVFRGSGRAEKGSVYNEFGSGEPIFKDATYYAFDPKVAAEYGPNVEASKVGIEKPLVLQNDEQYRALSRQAGMQFPNPFGLEPVAQAAEFQKLRDLVTAKGHDGIVVQMDTYGDNAKLLRNLFGDDQVIDFKSSAKSASVPASDLAARQAAKAAELNLTPEELSHLGINPGVGPGRDLAGEEYQRNVTKGGEPAATVPPAPISKTGFESVEEVHARTAAGTQRLEESPSGTSVSIFGAEYVKTDNGSWQQTNPKEHPGIPKSGSSETLGRMGADTIAPWNRNPAIESSVEEPLNAFKKPQYDVDASGNPVKLPESGGTGKPPSEPSPAPPSAGPESTPENPHGMYVTPEGLATAEAARNASLTAEGSPTQSFKDFLGERKPQNGATPPETPPVERGPRDELGRPIINQGKGNGIGGKPPIDTGTAGGEEVPPGDTSSRWKEAPRLPAGSIGQNLLDLSRAPIGFKVLAHDTLLKQDGPSIILSPKAVLESKKASFRAIRSPEEAQAVMNEVQQMPWMNSKNNPLDFNPNRLRQSKFGIGVESESRESEAQLMGGTSATARAFQSIPFMQANERFYAVGKNVERAYQSNVLLQNLYDHGLETARKGSMFDAERGAVSSPVSPSGRTLGVIADSGPDSMHPKFFSDAEKEWYQRQVIAGAGRFTSWMNPKSDEVAYQRGMQQFKAIQDVLNHRTQYGSWRQGWAPLFSTRAFSGRIQMLADPFVQPGSIFSNSARQEAIKSVMAQASFSGAQLGLASALGAKIGFGSAKFGYGLPTATWTGPDGSKHSYNPWAGISGPTSAVIKTAQFQGQPDKQLAAWVDLLNSNLSPTFSLGKEVATGTNWQGKTFGGTEKQTGDNPVQWGATALHNLGAIGQRKDTYVQLAAPIWLESALNLLKHDPAWMAALETIPATEASGVNVTGKATSNTKPLLPLQPSSNTPGGTGGTKPLPPLPPRQAPVQQQQQQAPTTRPLPQLPSSTPAGTRQLPSLPQVQPTTTTTSPSRSRTRVPIYGSP